MTGDNLNALLVNAHLDRHMILEWDKSLRCMLAATIRACDRSVAAHLSDHKSRASELLDNIRSDCEAAIERYMAEMRDLVPSDDEIEESWADAVAEAKTEARGP